MEVFRTAKYSTQRNALIFIRELKSARADWKKYNEKTAFFIWKVNTFIRTFNRKRLSRNARITQSKNGSECIEQYSSRWRLVWRDTAGWISFIYYHWKMFFVLSHSFAKIIIYQNNAIPKMAWVSRFDTRIKRPANYSSHLNTLQFCVAWISKWILLFIMNFLLLNLLHFRLIDDLLKYNIRIDQRSFVFKELSFEYRRYGNERKSCLTWSKW